MFLTIQTFSREKKNEKQKFALLAALVLITKRCSPRQWERRYRASTNSISYRTTNVRAYGRRFWCKWAVLLMLRRRQGEARGCTQVQHARLAAVSFGKATCLTASYETVAWETTVLHRCLHTCTCTCKCTCISTPLRNYRAECFVVDVVVPLHIWV